jgi:cell division protein FtsB
MEIADVISAGAAATVIAAGVSYFFVQLRKTTIDTLRENNAALSDKVTILQQDIEGLKNSNAKLSAQVDHMTSEYGGLRAVVDAALDRYLESNPEIIKKLMRPQK